MSSNFGTSRSDLETMSPQQIQEKFPYLWALTNIRREVIELAEHRETLKAAIRAENAVRHVNTEDCPAPEEVIGINGTLVDAYYTRCCVAYPRIAVWDFPISSVTVTNRGAE